MIADRFLKSKLKRQMDWNGRDITLYRYERDSYNQLTDRVDFEYTIRAVFHEGGGYGGMLNIELYENDGARTVSKMKPMLLCMYKDGEQIDSNDWLMVGNRKFSVVDKSDVSGLGVAWEVSLELYNGRGN